MQPRFEYDSTYYRAMDSEQVIGLLLFGIFAAVVAFVFAAFVL
jgi:hypothetical protein